MSSPVAKHAATLCDRTRSNETTERNVTFTMKDERGRQVGANVRLYAVTFTPAPAGQFYGYRQQPGTYFVCDVQATRDGIRFGASNRDSYHATFAEADAKAAERCAVMAKRYAKKYGA